MVDLHMLNNNTEQILEQTKFICRSYRRFLLKFYGWPIHKTEKNMRLLHIFGHNFFSRSYFHMKIAQIVYRSRTQISWKFEANSTIIPRYIVSFLILWISENKIKSLGDSPD